MFLTRVDLPFIVLDLWLGLNSLYYDKQVKYTKDRRLVVRRRSYLDYLGCENRHTDRLME